ncbi:MAG: peptidase [Novosphingobium lindaniclasticum]|jgi:carboxyl-terminal processing protease|uniref:Peptidase S41 n=1 Tax=Novosphingobium lindaniclasticum LE124 TaxID=1096930 RepID=T0HK70_9SPHN|nr:S41 family peptidase [Novosphingobium lindaniclasticum]EQB12578.1 peptidase S41 [Novosphingobium lindaniclasticum LE124]MDF2637736.1 peptidase [Novosphingobium lindaniclasticum]
MKFAPLMRAALLVSAVAVLPAATSGLAAVDSRVNPEFSKLFTIYELVKANYVDQVDDDKLIKGAIDGMLASLDPHSNYLDGPSLQRLETMIDGNYTGLGLSVVEDDGAVKIISPFKGSPAEKAGLKAGDYITHLDGVLYYERDLDEAVSKMRGQAGTSIRLTIYRPGRDKPFDVTVTRGVIELEPVTWELKNDVGVISVNEFSRDVGNFVNRGIADLKKQAATKGVKLDGLVLDLRSNPGGSLDEAVALSDLFLDKGVIVSQRGRIASENQYYRAESMFKGDVVKGMPIVVLVDAGSASASEIVAGALQDQHRAVVMGERTFGKGSVQSFIQLDKNSAVKLTTARYFTPSGHSVQEGGIVPDLKVPQLSDPDARARAERAVRESDLRGHLINEASLDDKELETDKKEDPRFKATAEDLKKQGIEDFQLAYAIDTLRRTAGKPALARYSAPVATVPAQASAAPKTVQKD